MSMNSRRRWLAPYRRLWNAKRDALDRHLDEGGT